MATLQAASKPLWYDEIITIIVSGLPERAQIYPALLDAVDGNPWPFYLITRAFATLAADPHVAYRLPAIAGFVAAIICVYFAVSKHAGRLAGLAAATFLMNTPAGEFAYEARPYGLVLGCVALAFVAWQRAGGSDGFAALLAAALALACSTHFYAVLAWPAFVAAECAVWFTRRQFRGWIWLALLAGVVPLLLFRDQAAAIREYYGGNFWAVPSPLMIVMATNWLFEIRHLGLVIAVSISLALLYRMSPASARQLLSPAVSVLPRPEWPGAVNILVLGLVAVPVVGVGVSMVTGNGMVERYLLPASVGGSIGLGLVLGGLPRIAPVIVILLTCVAYGLQIPRLAVDAARGTLVERRLAAVQPVEDAVKQLDIGTPVVISDGLVFLQAAYYLQPRNESRQLVTLIDAPSAIAHVGTDSVDRGLRVLRKYSKIRAMDYRAFAARHRTFMLVSTGGGFDWWPERLAADGHRLTLVLEHQKIRVYRVELEDRGR